LKRTPKEIWEEWEESSLEIRDKTADCSRVELRFYQLDIYQTNWKQPIESEERKNATRVLALGFFYGLEI
jgi:hypothetical protein